MYSFFSLQFAQKKKGKMNCARSSLEKNRFYIYSFNQLCVISVMNILHKLTGRFYICKSKSAQILKCYYERAEVIVLKV